jgi:hypothetical protein
MPKILITLENLTILFLAVYLYYVLQGSWLIFVILFLVPDVSMIGYLLNPKIGSYIYNAVHNYTIPVFLLILAAILRHDLLSQVSCIFAAHVALDRALGFGLKYPTHFKDTHTQRL